MRCSLLLTLLISSIAFAQNIKQSDIEQAQKDQYAEIERYLDQRIADAANDRRELHKYDFFSLDAYEKSIEPLRPKLAELLGGLDYPKLDLKPTQELVADLPTHRAYRIFLPAFEKVRIYGILLEPKSKGPHPAMMCIHGMSSGPEAVCGLAEKPDYTNNFGLQAVQRGYLVFAPLDINNFKTRSWLDRKAILVGQRLQGLEQLKILRITDYLASRSDVDAKRIGAYGISWGGRTVMCAAALDRRIAATAISGHFNDFIPKMVTPSEHYTAFIQTPEDYSFFWKHARLFTDADVVSLICPRPVFIEQGKQDRVAYWEMSQKAFGEVKSIYEKLGIGDRAVYSIFEGPHEIDGKEAFEFFDKWLKK
jgi:hypothetical protein